MEETIMEKTFFLLDCFFKISGIPVRYLSPDGDIALLELGFEKSCDPLPNPAFQSNILLQTKDATPRLYFEGDEILACSFQDNIDHWLVLGPVCLLPLSQKSQEDYARQHDLPATSLHLPCIDLKAFSSAVSMLYCQFTGRMVAETELVLYSAEQKPPQVSHGERLQPYQLKNIDMELHRLSYLEEQEIMSRITRGEVDSIKRSYSLADLSLVTTAVGKLVDQPLKNLEYMFCSSITLATRAAITGGLSDEEAYSIADVLLQELALCKDAKSMIRVQMECMYTFASCVKQAKEQACHINYVEQAKQYLQKHINKSFSLDELCSTVGINKSYLCRKFKEAEGVTIIHYLQGLRVDAAKNMLRYSNQDLSSIAVYLCFPSQSRFGEIFKQFTGTTPKKYREKYREENR